MVAPVTSSTSAGSVPSRSGGGGWLNGQMIRGIPNKYLLAGVVGLSGVVLYIRKKRAAAAAAASSSSSGQNATGAIDPNTGVPYSQEETAYEDQGQGSVGGSFNPSQFYGLQGQPCGCTGGGTGTTDSTGTCQCSDTTSTTSTTTSAGQTTDQPITAGSIVQGIEASGMPKLLGSGYLTNSSGGLTPGVPQTAGAYQYITDPNQLAAAEQAGQKAYYEPSPGLFLPSAGVKLMQGTPQYLKVG